MTITGTPRGAPRPPGPDPFSLTVTPVTPMFQATRLSSATGFFLRTTDGQSYLVTNWHVVTGINPMTGRHLSTTNAEPNQLEFDVFVMGDSRRRGQRLVALYDENERPRWLEHPRWGRQLDVVCVPIEVPRAEVHPLNELNFDPIRLGVGLDTFILGYPLGLGADRLPIWKRASIASEPTVDLEGLPLMYVDTASATGMSGSPVIIRTTSGDMDDGTFRVAFNVMNRLVGVYSGRQPVGERLEAQLGRVWKTDALLQIIDNGVRGLIR